MGWPLLGIRNKFIHQKYQEYRISLISGIINIGYQKYQVPYQIYRVSDILCIRKISGIKNIGYQKYRVSDIRNRGYLLISVLSYQSSIIEKMSELPVTNQHIPT